MGQYASRENFIRAHGRAKREEVLARLSRRPTSLLPFETLSAILNGYQQIPRQKSEMIPLDKIAGSVGRYKDFTRDFLPKSSAMLDRWARVETAMESLEGTPPIEVFRIGGVYFVTDGNHRVSVARASGFDSIEAHVTDIAVDCDLEPGDSLDEAIMKAERARFLNETHLDRHAPHLDIYFTRPGGFLKILEHVQIHRRLLCQAQGGDEQATQAFQDDTEQGALRGCAISLADAAADWYDNSYCPIIQVIRDRQLLRRFPGRTAADLYVWLWGYIFETHRRFGEKIDPEEAASAMELRAPSGFHAAVQTLMNRLTEVSRSILPSGEPVPDWIVQTFEWDDGSLSELANSAR